MTERLTIECWNPQQAHKAISEQAWPTLKSWLMAGHKSTVTIRRRRRSDEQSSLFHSLIGQIAAQLGGDLSDPEDAKRILISAFRIDTRNDPDLAEAWGKFGDIRMGRGLRGEVVLMGTQSREFGVKLGSAFIEWLFAFGSEHGVTFKEPHAAV